MRRRRPDAYDAHDDFVLIMQTLMRLSEQLDRIESLLQGDDGEEEDEDDT